MSVPLTLERLRELFSYDPETGVFTRLITTSRKSLAGDETRGTYMASSRRRSIYIDGRNYYSYRLAWVHFYGVWPKNLIDHINGNSDDNRIINLRDVDSSINLQNRNQKSGNQSGFLGVHYDKERKTYCAQIELNRNKFNQIRRMKRGFATPELAFQQYLEWKREIHLGNML